MSACLLVLLALGVLGCDEAAKKVAAERLEGRPGVEVVPGVLDLHYVENRGAAFNVERVLPAGWRRPLVVVTRLLMFPLLVLLWIRRRPAWWWGEAGFALVIGGALGNLVDTLVRGFVVDFIHLAYWPVFNVADVAIVGGMILILVEGAWGRERAVSA